MRMCLLASLESVLWQYSSAGSCVIPPQHLRLIADKNIKFHNAIILIKLGVLEINGIKEKNSKLQKIPQN